MLTLEGGGGRDLLVVFVVDSRLHLDLTPETVLQGLRVSLLQVPDHVRGVVFLQQGTMLSVNVIPKCR
jgi:hypothetical protein